MRAGLLTGAKTIALNANLNLSKLFNSPVNSLINAWILLSYTFPKKARVICRFSFAVHFTPLKFRQFSCHSKNTLLISTGNSIAIKSLLSINLLYQKTTLYRKIVFSAEHDRLHYNLF